MANKLMFIPKDYTQNYPFCSLKLVVQTLEHSIKQSPQSLSQRIRKRYHETLGTSVINSTLSTLSL